MSNQEFTYNFKKLIPTIIVWEIVSILIVSGVFYFLGYNSTSKGEHLAFRYPMLLWLELLILPLLGLLLFQLNKLNSIVGKISKNTRLSIFSSVSTAHVAIKYILFRIAFTTLVITIAQPFYGSKKVAGTVESLELVIALDISNSMNTRDIDKELTRLDIAKRAITQLINNLHGEKLGLTIFAGSAYVQLPVTNDYNAAKMFVNEIESGMISNQGTNISAVLQTAMSMFSKAKVSKSIILVTDGENHEENPAVVYEALKESEIQICVLGIGTEQGGLIPNNPSRPELGYKQTAAGNPIQSKLDVNFIKQIADNTNGVGVVSSSPFPDLRMLLDKINHMKRSKMEDIEFNVSQSRYHISLFISLLFWISYLTWDRKYSDRLFKMKKI
jgi:Ca-activated chloride channel family protein